MNYTKNPKGEIKTTHTYTTGCSSFGLRANTNIKAHFRVIVSYKTEKMLNDKSNEILDFLKQNPLSSSKEIYE